MVSPGVVEPDQGWRFLSKDSFGASHSLGHSSFYSSNDWDVTAKLWTTTMMARKS